MNRMSELGSGSGARGNDSIKNTGSVASDRGIQPGQRGAEQLLRPKNLRAWRADGGLGRPCRARRAGRCDGGARANRGSDNAGARGIPTSADRDHFPASTAARQWRRSATRRSRRAAAAAASRAAGAADHSAKSLRGIAGRPHRHRRLLRRQHVIGDQDQHPADQRSAIGQRSDQGFHCGSEHPQHHRSVAPCSGVAVHQGEGNRDELVIRGVDTSANFFVNGFRDDVQYYRDIYNTQSIEVMKGPSALVFGRGAGGGVVNRTLKEADGTRVYEATAQTGSYGDRRVTLDAGQAVSENVAVRLNAFYEGSDTFRDYGHLERYGFNPTVTLKPDDDTKVKLSYEFYHDKEVADRGNPL